MSDKKQPKGSISYLFPTPLYASKEILTEDENAVLLQRIMGIKEKNPKPGATEWSCQTYNSLNTHDMINDPVFKLLKDRINEGIAEFVDAHSSPAVYEAYEMWANVYDLLDYQEFHFHPHSTFSGVYLVKVPEGSGALTFESPSEPDMLAPPATKANPLVTKRAAIAPQERGLVIFRSYLRHMVPQGTQVDPRVSIAFNACPALSPIGEK